MATISLSLPSDGQTIDAADVNTPFNTVAAAINGNLDNDNIASGANISGTKLLAASTPLSVLDATSRGGWIAGVLAAPNTVTALGNRSYNLVFNSTDYTDELSVGQRLRMTRTVAAPTQCTDLESGSSQYYSKTSPAGMTFTDDFVASAWVKLESYADMTIISRYNGTSGWKFNINLVGQVQLVGYNAGAANYSYVQSYQSIPLGKWVHVAAQLDMSAFTATTTTSYVMIDGVDVPASVTRAGTNPTALVQAGDLQIGRNNTSEYFDGKIAQVAIYNAKVTQATILASMNQTLSGSETSLVSAYSFNNSINDLSANANNLTANAGAVATNADSPFAGATGTNEYGIVTNSVFSTNTTLTVQVPEGYALPTTGGVSAVSYSTQDTPYGFPRAKGKWRVNFLWKTQSNTASNATYAAFTGMSFIVPIGDWTVGYNFGFFAQSTVDVGWALASTSQAGLAITAADSRIASRITGSAAPTTAIQSYVSDNFSHDVATTYVMYQIGTTTANGVLGSSTKCELFAECAYV